MRALTVARRLESQSSLRGGSAAAVDVKDAIRARCVPQIVSACVGVVVAHAPERPGLAASCLRALSSYVPWIPVELIANDRVLALLYSLFPVPSSGAAPAVAAEAPLSHAGAAPHGVAVSEERAQLGCAACACLRELADKGMPPSAYFRLMQFQGGGRSFLG